MDLNASEGVNRVEVFCCYARKDQQWLLELKTHLAPLQREGLIALWDDMDIHPGDEWEKEIRRHLDRAQIILLLVSPNFIASDYGYSVEMQQAMEQHERGKAQVIPIILHHVSWQKAPFGKLQALPTNARPITSDHWHHPNDAFYSVVEGIRKAVKASERRNPLGNLSSPVGQALRPDIPPQRRSYNLLHYRVWLSTVFILLFGLLSGLMLNQIPSSFTITTDIGTFSLNSNTPTLNSNDPTDRQAIILVIRHRIDSTLVDTSYNLKQKAAKIILNNELPILIDHGYTFIDLSAYVTSHIEVRDINAITTYFISAS